MNQTSANLLKSEFGIPFVNYDGLLESVCDEITYTIQEVLLNYSLLVGNIHAVGFFEDIERELNAIRMSQDSSLKYMKLKGTDAPFQAVIYKDSHGNILFSGLGFSSKIKKLSLRDFRSLPSNKGIAPHTKSLKGQVFHELGHILDEYLGISKSQDFLQFLESRTITLDVIKKEVSEYAATSPSEFIAEVFAEYQSGKGNTLVCEMMEYIETTYSRFAEHKKII